MGEPEDRETDLSYYAYLWTFVLSLRQSWRERGRSFQLHEESTDYHSHFTRKGKYERRLTWVYTKHLDDIRAHLMSKGSKTSSWNISIRSKVFLPSFLSPSIISYIWLQLRLYIITFTRKRTETETNGLLSIQIQMCRRGSKRKRKRCEASV